jgi:hypothetical protein
MNLFILLSTQTAVAIRSRRARTGLVAAVMVTELQLVS